MLSIVQAIAGRQQIILDTDEHSGVGEGSFMLLNGIYLIVLTWALLRYQAFS